MIMMKKKIAVGMFLVLAIAIVIALALGFAQLYPGTIKEPEVGCDKDKSQEIAKQPYLQV